MGTYLLTATVREDAIGVRYVTMRAEWEFPVGLKVKVMIARHQDIDSNVMDMFTAFVVKRGRGTAFNVPKKEVTDLTAGTLVDMMIEVDDKERRRLLDNS